MDQARHLSHANFCTMNGQKAYFRSFVFETVMSAEDKVDFILRAKEMVFFIRVFFISTDHPSINSSRIALRVMQGGHDVPIPKIVSRYYKSIANCKTISSVVDQIACMSMTTQLTGKMPDCCSDWRTAL